MTEFDKNLKLLLKDHQKMRMVEVRGALTLPKTILQLLLQGKTPPLKMVEEALKSIDEIVDQTKQV